MDEVKTRRLAFIRYLYKIGVDQSNQPEPLNAVSLLSFHDAVELFLQVSAEHLNVNKTDNEFMSYWDIINLKLKPNEITQKESMRRLNKARVQLKHNGTSPSKLDIESFRATTTSFFNENTSIVFGIEFNSISMIELITYENTKSRLDTARNLILDNKIEDALREIAISFAYLIHDYEQKKRTQYGRSPFYFGQSLTFQNSFFMGVDGKMKDFVDRVKESIESIQKAIKILSLGFDYKKYSKFKLLTPYAEINWDEPIVGKLSENATLEDCEFCFNYVIESTIKLQDFDYDIQSSINK